MSIDRSQVLHVAKLARLALSENQLDQMARDLSEVLKYVQLLDELEVDSVEPLAHAADLHNVFAEDEVAESLPREAALANAPKRDEECFRVPAVL